MRPTARCCPPQRLTRLSRTTAEAARTTETVNPTHATQHCGCTHPPPRVFRREDSRAPAMRQKIAPRTRRTQQEEATGAIQEMDSPRVAQAHQPKVFR